ncbi:MAG: ABC transporter ATP-binding protein/permease [Candidatus Omnitrophica bacterium]|nr:ABC transporter ATP-binding protein/permease [Candidatus Omnitrophota bacterium]
MKNYLKLLKFLRPQLGIFCIALLATAISAALNGITILSILPLVDIVFTGKQIIIPTTLPPFLSGLVDKLNAVDPAVLFKVLVISIVPYFFVKGIFFWLQGYLMNAVAYRTVREVRNKLFQKLQELSLAFYSRQRTGELMSRITNDVGCINNAISFAFRDLIHESFRFLIYVGFAFAIGGKVALITVIFLPLIVMPIARIGRRLKKISTQTQEKVADISSLLSETISGVRIVKAFSMEDYELGRFKAQNQRYFSYLMKATKRMLLSTPISEMAGAIATTVILAIWGREVARGNISFGGFSVVMGSLMSLMQPLKKLTGVHFTTQQGLAANKRIYEILDTEVLVKDSVGAIDIPILKDKIVFKDVWFKYEGSSEDVLSGTNLEVKRGEMIAVVGPSGAGKTTMINLIPRFYDPYKGSILFDGKNIKDASLKSVRNLVGMVTQEMILFNDTIRANIAYGNQDTTNQQIEEAAKKASAHEFIMNLPEKYDTVIGDRGFRLSGGEKQRVAIARAILKDAPILILDEATSNLDSASEQLVKDALYTLMQGKTSFVIAHRLSTVQKADKIVVLDKGNIVGIGTHAHLIETNSLYKKLHDLQFNA